MAELTAEERRRNVERVVEAERAVELMERQLGTHVYEGVKLMREMRAVREKLRVVLAMDPAGPLAPLFDPATDHSVIIPGVPEQEEATDG